jgi:hypothetical protein
MLSDNEDSLRSLGTVELDGEPCLTRAINSALQLPQHTLGIIHLL